MAMDQQARSAKSAAKRKELEEEDLRLRVRKGEKEDLLVLMDWTSDKQQGSVMAACLRYVRSLGREGAIEALRSRHEIAISENVAREFRNQSLAEIKRDPGDEIEFPSLSDQSHSRSIDPV